jgi:Flavodoxins
MKIAIRYQSRGGNTKTVAEAIAKVVDVKAERIDVPLDGSVDFLFVGGGFYGGIVKGDIDHSLREYLETLDSNMVKSVVAFSTAGVVDGTKRIASSVRQKDINVHKDTLPLKVGTRNHRTFVKEGVLTLTDKEIARIERFVRNIVN